jgi:hypothetical protein
MLQALTETSSMLPVLDCTRALPIRHHAQLQTHLEFFPVAKNIPTFDACSAPLRQPLGLTLHYASFPVKAGRSLHPPPVKGARPCRRSPCDEPR